MASVSPAEVLELAKGLYHLYKKLRDAPDEMHQIAKHMILVETLVEDMNSPNNQLDYLKSSKGKKMANLLESELKSLKNLLLELKDIGKAWQNDRGSLLRRPIFTFVTMRHLPELRASIDVQLDNIRKIRAQANEAGAKLSDETMDRLVAKITQELANSGIALSQAQTDRQVKAEKARLALENAKKDESAVQIPHSTSTMPSLSEALEQAGLSPSDAKNLIALYEQELASGSELDAINPAPQGITKSKPKTTDNKSSQDKYTGTVEILVVDYHNGGRSVIAQTYLELIRAWTVNSEGGRWLFKRVDSAGFMIESEFRRGAGKLPKDSLSRAGARCSSASVDAIAGGPTYFATDDYPDEKKAIVNRIKKHRSQGIKARDFVRYDYILCFESDGYEKLQLLAERAKELHPAQTHKAQIIRLKGCSMTVGQGPATLVPPVRKAIKDFLMEEDMFAWERPFTSIAEGPCRTCWVSIGEEKRRDAVVGVGGAGRKRLEAATKCKIRTSWLNKEHGWITAITGPPECLAEAEKAVKAVFASAQAPP